MKILHIGSISASSTAAHRANALMRLGHHVTLYDASVGLFSSGFTGKLEYAFNIKTGFVGVQARILRKLKFFFKEQDFYDVIWINSGEFFGHHCLELLASRCRHLVLYVNDDPTGHRDGNRFSTLVKNIYKYSHSYVVRYQNVNEFKQRGAKNVSLLTMSYDEVYHAPPIWEAGEKTAWFFWAHILRANIEIGF